MTFYRQPVAAIILLFGFISGLPLALSASTLTLMLADNGVDIKLIGLFALVGIPYAFKYLWSPLIDNIKLPILNKLGRRKSWLLVVQTLLGLNIFAFSLLNPQNHLYLIALAALSLAFLSATQDIIIDAFRIELLPENQQAAGASTMVLGYRLGMLASNAGALYLAHFYSWGFSYFCMSLCVLFAGVSILFFVKEVKNISQKNEKFNFIHWLEKSYIGPFKNFIQKSNWWLVLLFIIFYKISDAFIGSLTSPFLLGIGYTKLDIANVVKIFGLVATFAGLLLGGFLLERMTIKNGLLLGLILQMISNIPFIALLYTGPDIIALAVVMSVENFCSGIGTAALVAYISNLCNVQYTATQYALLSSLASLGRTTFSAYAGFFQVAHGWAAFFIFSMLISIPAVVILLIFQKTFSIKSADRLAQKA